MDWQYPYLVPNWTPNLQWHPYLPTFPIRGGTYPRPHLPYPYPYPEYPLYRQYPTAFTQSALTPPKRTRHRNRNRTRSSNIGSSSSRSLNPQVSSLERAWLDTSSDTPENVPVFTLLCYNLLSQGLLDEHTYLYTHCPTQYSQWEYRKYYLLQQLIDSTADILCLQEMDETAYQAFFSPNLGESRFEGVYKRRTGNHGDGVAIFYNANKFAYVTHKCVEYKRDFRILDRDNVGIILKLRMLGENPSSAATPDNFLYVACTHLLFNPKAGDVKLAQVCVLLAELRELTSQDNEAHPLIICGDMNCLPNSCLYYFLRSGYLNYKYLFKSEVSGYKKPPNGHLPSPLLPEEVGINDACRKVDVNPTDTNETVNNTGISNYTLSHPYSFYSVYPHSLTEPSLVSTYHGSAFENVDYIFYSCPILEVEDSGDNFKPSRELRLISRYSLPSRDNLRQFGPLPNKFHSSDHLQLVAKFSYIT